MYEPERFTSISGKKYNIDPHKRGRYHNTLLYGVYYYAEREDDATIRLTVTFSTWFIRVLGEIPEQHGPPRQDVIEEVCKKFKTLLFYDKLLTDRTIHLTSENMSKQTEDKYIFEDFVILKSKPMKLKCRGYRNANPDISKMVEKEILRLLYENYSTALSDADIQKEIWYEPQRFMQAYTDLETKRYIEQGRVKTYKLTAEGRDYYEELIQNANRFSIGHNKRLHTKKWDIFIAHASEDKEEIARPLFHALEKKNLSVWIDEFELKLGDNLRRKIEEGLVNSKYGVVILSPSFFAKAWPQAELDGLFKLEMSHGSKRILPIWHNIDEKEVINHLPILAGRVAVKTSEGINTIVDEILNAIQE